MLCPCEGPAVQRRPSDLYSERFLYHIGSPGAAAAASAADGSGFSQTLPLNVLRNRSDASSTTRKDHRAPHHTVWPRKTDKIYTCDEQTPFPLRTTDSKGFTSNSFGRDFLQRDSSSRPYTATGGGGGSNALVQCIGVRDKDLVGWTTGNWMAPSTGPTVTTTAQPPPPPRGSASAAPGGCGSRNKDSWARDAGEFDDRVIRRKQSGIGDPSGASGGPQQGRCNRKTQQQQQQLIVNEDGRLVVTSGFDSLSQALPDTKV